MRRCLRGHELSKSHEVSILTPVAASHAHLVGEAWQSIRDQRVPPGWRIRWYVQEDGPRSAVADFVASLDGALAEYSASGSAGGAAEARNLALARSQGDITMMLDADDRLTPGAVQRVVETLRDGHMWCGFGAIDDRDGLHSQRKGGYSLRLGTDRSVPLEVGSFRGDTWLGASEKGSMRMCWEHYGVLPFHPATFATFSRWIWDAGCWPGLARDEDTALILALTDKHAGIVSAKPNIVYRRHTEQTSRLVPPNDERLAFIRRRR